MKLEELKAMKTGDKILISNGEVRCLAGVVNDCVITASPNGRNTRSWGSLSLANFKPYVEPKVRTKFYLYVKCNGNHSSFFYTYNLEKYWTGEEVAGNLMSEVPTDWIRTNTFMEIEV